MMVYDFVQISKYNASNHGGRGDPKVKVIYNASRCIVENS